MTKNKTTKTRVKLTNKLVDSLAALPPELRTRRYWDTETPALYLQFGDTGASSYMMRYTRPDGTTGEFSIGPSKFISADAARAACKEHLSALILHGVDPVKARREARAEAAAPKVDTTFKGVAEAYIARKLEMRAAKNKTRKLAEVDLLRRLVYPLIGPLEITKINQAQIEEALEDIEIGVLKRMRSAEFDGRTTSVACHKAIKRVWKYAIAKELTVRNPAAFKCAEDTPQKRRGRMDDQRFKLFWDHLHQGYVDGAQTIAPLAIMIYMATLQRPVDIARAKRADFDLASRTWRPKDTKTGTEYFVPLSELAYSLIAHAMSLTDSEWLFPKKKGGEGHFLETSMGNYWFVLRKRLLEEGLLLNDDINQYDCRRYGRTLLVHRLKFSRDVAELVINHHQKSGMESLYDVHDFEPDVRAAQEAWGEEMMRMCKIDLDQLIQS